MNIYIFSMIASIIFILGTIIGDQVKENELYKNCITYHNNMTVIEANNTCKNIFEGTRK